MSINSLKIGTFTCFLHVFYQLNVEIQALNNRYNELETVVKDQHYVCREITVAEESLNHRISTLEEEVEDLKTQNNELRRHANKIVEELNCVITTLNTRYIVEN